MNHTGTPDGIASTVTLQLSERTGWVTGAVCHVDGGVTAGRNRSTSVAE
ncbi:SDR family oxidoreductase [Streptomyces sp. NBC_00510]